MSRYIDAEKLKIIYASKDVEKYADAFNKLVDAMPTADVRENVRGEWLLRKDTTECSSCNTKWRDYRGLISTFSFCPDCGADMQGEA